jgi:hypothetical protein
MQNQLMEQAPGQMDRPLRHDDLTLLAIAVGMAVVHIATNSRYGFHRDELQTLSDALHMDWGFVAYPPFTPFVERVGLALFGHSLIGLRMFSVGRTVHGDLHYRFNGAGTRWGKAGTGHSGNFSGAGAACDVRRHRVSIHDL